MATEKKWSINPGNHTIGKFYDEYASCSLLPSIQREFVWDVKDVKELLESIVKGYPIGAIIYLESDSDKDFPNAPLYDQENGRKGARKHYIIDGQQRLTSLLLIKNGWKINREGRKITNSVFRIGYNPDTKEFLISKTRGIDVSLLVRAALSDSDALEELKKFPNYKQALDEVGRKVVQYELPFYKMEPLGEFVDEDYGEIAKIFIRINRMGVKIENTHMFLSFFAASFGKSKKKIIAVHEKFGHSFGLDLATLIRFMFSKMGKEGRKQGEITKMDRFEKTIKKIEDECNEQKIGEIITDTERAIDIVLETIKEKLGLSYDTFVPSEIALLPLFDYVYQQGFKKMESIPEKECNRMLKWFLITSFEGYYSSSVDRKIDETFEILESNGGKTFPFNELQKRMYADMGVKTIQKKWITEEPHDAYANAGKEYQMLLYILLVRNNATDWCGASIKNRETDKDKPLDKHHIFPREFLEENDITKSEDINDIANLTLISEENQSIGAKKPEEYLQSIADVSEEVLKQHFIPLDKRLWKIEKYYEFLKARSKLLWKATEDLLNE